MLPTARFAPPHADSGQGQRLPRQLPGPRQGPCLLPGRHPSWLGTPALPGLLEDVSAPVPARREAGQGVRPTPGAAGGDRGHALIGFRGLRLHHGPRSAPPYLRPLKKKGFKEERGTTIGLDDIGKSTTLESNKSLVAKHNSFHYRGGKGLISGICHELSQAACLAHGSPSLAQGFGGSVGPAYSPENGPTQEARPAGVVVEEEVARYLSCGVEAGDGIVLGVYHPTLAVYLDAAEGEGDTAGCRVHHIRGRVYGEGPVGLGGLQAEGTLGVFYSGVEVAPLHGGVECLHRVHQGIGGDVQLLGYLPDGVANDGTARGVSLLQRMHRLLVENLIGEGTGLGQDGTA